ncbi:hypothetical protein TWF481_003258 [Arthrobotrys musiformis]|uniref:F-box domain-containing protein n=1 Tax=Arthrobotrys musiformis TaxID=47236 RepID=A0AAV9VSQ7_9PEZI
MKSLEQPKPSILFSFPPELHLEILSHLTRVEDQVSASLACSCWRNLLSNSESLRNIRYAIPQGEHTGIHPLVSPETSWLSITSQAGVVKAYNLWRFNYQDNEAVRRSSGFDPEANNDEEAILKHQRNYPDIKSPISKLDISSCQFLDEPFFSPYLQLEVPENDWRDNFELGEPIPDQAMLKNMLRGFLVPIYSSEGYPFERHFLSFQVSREQIPGLTLRALLDIVAKGSGEAIREDIGYGFKLPMNLESEHDILIDQNWFYRSAFSPPEMCVKAIVIPCDDKEREDAIQIIDARKASGIVYC